MRKITEWAVRAFYNWENYKKSNTKVVNEKWNTKMYLYDNLISEYNWKWLAISSADWETNTTKERLNWLLENWMYIKQKNWKWFLCDRIWNEIDFVKWNKLNWVYIF